MFAHLWQQAPVIGATARLLFAARGGARPELPGPLLTETAAPRPAWLVADYVRTVGGDPKAWAGRLPPHMFPQWGWPLLTRCLHGLPYDLTKVVNAGCRWEARAPLPADQPLQLQARLASVDDDGRRALLEVELTTGTAEVPQALVATMVAYCPTGKATEGGGRGREKPTVPVDARPVAERRLSADLGWRFALATGDFNPIHWLGPYAKAAGFGGVILHGFGTAAVAAEALIRDRFAGDVDRLRGLEARFTRPLRLPATVQIFLGGRPAGDATTLHEGAVPFTVGTAPGGPAFLVGGLHA